MVGWLSTAIAVIFIGIGAILDYKSCAPTHVYADLKFENVLTAMGTFSFTQSGHHAFPTIQHDMRRPSDFHKTTFSGFASWF